MAIAVMYTLKKEFAGAKISVGKYRIDITNENVKDPFVQKVISETKSIQSMFDSTPEPKSLSSRAPVNES